MQCHNFFENLEEEAAGGQSPGSTDASEKKYEIEVTTELIGDVEKVPLNDSITYEEVTESQHDDVDRKNDEFLSQAAMALVEKGQASKVMADLENLLETGYAELILSEQLSEGHENAPHQEKGAHE